MNIICLINNYANYIKNNDNPEFKKNINEARL